MAFLILQFEYTDLEVEIQSESNMVSCKFSSSKYRSKLLEQRLRNVTLVIRLIDDSEPEKTLQGFSKITLNPR